MLLVDLLAAFQVGDGAGHLEDAVVGAGRETEAVGYHLQHPVAVGVQFAEFLDEARRHLGIAMDFGAAVALLLNMAGALDPPGDVGRTFRLAAISKIAILDRRHLDVDVDAVQQRAGNAGTVAVDGDGGAGAGVDRVS